MTQLTDELVEQVRSLSVDDKERLLDLLADELLPPVKDIDWAEIQRRMDDHRANPSATLTIEQAREKVRTEMRKIGLELP